MRTFASLFTLALLASLARGEEIWRWKDTAGTIHYSNQAELAPADATPVTTQLVIDAKRLPDAEPDLVMHDGTVMDVGAARPAPSAPSKRPHVIYTQKRLAFDCFAAGVAYAGGWSHADDING